MGSQVPEEYDEIRETIKLYKLVIENPDLFEEELSGTAEWRIVKVLADTPSMYLVLEVRSRG